MHINMRSSESIMAFFVFQCFNSCQVSPPLPFSPIVFDCFQYSVSIFGLTLLTRRRVSYTCSRGSMGLLMKILLILFVPTHLESKLRTKTRQPYKMLPKVIAHKIYSLTFPNSSIKGARIV